MIGLGITYEVAFLLSGVFAFCCCYTWGRAAFTFCINVFDTFIIVENETAPDKAYPLVIYNISAWCSWLRGIELCRQGIQSIILAFSITFVLLLSIRLCAREKPEHDLQSLLLGLFLLFAGTVLHTQISYAPVFLGYVITTVWTLIAWQLLYGNLEKNESSESVVRQKFGRRDVVSLSFFRRNNWCCHRVTGFHRGLFRFFPGLA